MSAMTIEAADQDAIVRDAEAAVARIAEARTEIGRVIFGQAAVVERTLVTLLSGGHGLLVGVPGLAKTKLVVTLGTVLGLEAHRIQFTPDLMPSDIVGAEVLEQGRDGSRSFRFIAGPVFAQLLMADEINRASPRTQSALLQAMQEGHVTVAGQRYDLPKPFHVLATQNPLEQEGTYPLPEAQLDRFLLQIDVHYPDREAERRILVETTGAGEAEPRAVERRGPLGIRCRDHEMIEHLDRSWRDLGRACESFAPLKKEQPDAMGGLRRRAGALPCQRAARGKVRARAIADSFRRKAKTRQAMVRFFDVANFKSQTGEPLALFLERGTDAIGSRALARRRHQLKRGVVEHKDRRGCAVALRAPHRRAAEQRLITGNAGFDVANQNDGVIKSSNHDGDKARMGSRT